MATKTSTSTKKSTKSPAVSLGAVVMIYSKSSSHGVALLEPKVVTIEDLKFIEGTQITGKPGHRMEKKRTLVPFDHVASIVEFAAEEELWSEPQPKHLRLPPDETKLSPPLTSHEQGGQPQGHPNHRGGHRNRDNRHRGPRGGGGPSQPKDNDARLQARYDARRERDFNR